MKKYRCLECGKPSKLFYRIQYTSTTTIAGHSTTGPGVMLTSRCISHALELGNGYLISPEDFEVAQVVDQ